MLLSHRSYTLSLLYLFVTIAMSYFRLVNVQDDDRKRCTMTNLTVLRKYLRGYFMIEVCKKMSFPLMPKQHPIRKYLCSKKNPYFILIKSLPLS